MLRPVFSAVILLTFVGLLTDASAQNHFSSCLDGTGNIFNATIIIPASSRPTVNNLPLPVNSEVAVFATDPGFSDRCVGVMTLSGASGAVTIWGDDAITPGRDGLLEGEGFVFKIWDSELKFEYPSNVISSSFPIYERVYANDKTYVLRDLSVFWSMHGVTVQDDNVAILEDEPLTVDVLSNDYSQSENSVEIFHVGTPMNGTASLTTAGFIEYLPHPNFFGSDSLSYFATDASGNVGQGTLYIEVTSINDAPILVSRPPLSATVGSPYFFALVGDDIENDHLNYIAESVPDWLSLAVSNNNTATLSGSPGVQNVGTTDISLGITDNTDTTWVSFSVEVQSAGNQAPVALDDVYSVPEDSVLFFNVLGNDSDPDGDLLFISDVSTVENGILVQLSDGWMEYVPTTNFSGTEFFVYSASDSSGATTQAAVQILVTPVNDPAVISSEPLTRVQVGYPYSYVVRATDVESDPLSFAFADKPSWLELIDSGNGSATMAGSPTDSEIGRHIVSVEVSDGKAITFQTFEIFVSLITPPPIDTDPPVNTDPPFGLTVPTSPELLVEEGLVGTGSDLQFYWNPVPSAEKYHFQLDQGRAPDYSSPVAEDSLLTVTTFSVPILNNQTWYAWRVRAANSSGLGPWSESISFLTDEALAPDELLAPNERGESKESPGVNGTIPESVDLLQNYPNPFNPSTTIAFELPSRLFVVLEIFDLLGHRVETLVNDMREAGTHEIRWSAKRLQSGVYVYRIKAGNSVISRTFSLIK